MAFKQHAIGEFTPAANILLLLQLVVRIESMPNDLTVDVLERMARYAEAMLLKFVYFFVVFIILQNN